MLIVIIMSVNFFTQMIHPDHQCNTYHVDYLSDQHDIYHYVKDKIDNDPNVFEEYNH